MDLGNADHATPRGTPGKDQVMHGRVHCIVVYRDMIHACDHRSECAKCLPRLEERPAAMKIASCHGGDPTISEEH